MTNKLKNNFVLDVESDGPHPVGYNMISFAIVSLENPSESFYSGVYPEWQNGGGIPEARAVCGISWEEQEKFEHPNIVMTKCLNWLNEISSKRKILWSDNCAFDWQFINFYFHKYCDLNPFGFSARRIGDYYSGQQNNPFAASEWKKFRKTKHSHNALDDAMGNVEALRKIQGYYCK